MPTHMKRNLGGAYNYQTPGMIQITERTVSFHHRMGLGLRSVVAVHHDGTGGQFGLHIAVLADMSRGYIAGRVGANRKIAVKIRFRMYDGRMVHGLVHIQHRGKTS